MKQLLDTVWQRRGVSWIWNDDALHTIARPDEVISLRQLLRLIGQWPDDLPSNNGNAMVVAGLDACLDLMAPEAADAWLGIGLKHTILSFQDAYDGLAALVFWLPAGQRRVHIQTSTDDVLWRCGAPHGDQEIDFGRRLWGDAGQYPQEILLAKGAKAAGLFHLRIS